MRSCLERTPLIPTLAHKSFNSGADWPSNSAFFCTTTARILASFALISARIFASCSRRASIIFSFLPISSPAFEASCFKSSRYMAFSSFFRASACSSSRFAAASSSLTSSFSASTSISSSSSSCSSTSSHGAATFAAFFEAAAAGFFITLPAGATTSSSIFSATSSSMAILPTLAIAETALRLAGMMSRGRGVRYRCRASSEPK
mmetsp:Transcript_163140/g.301148  ORF Transcript_163140/g.301148 Transcript_163140/m.301148 type:complete len:204 (+) Transcript_163140:1269-1880(+)